MFGEAWHLGMEILLRHGFHDEAVNGATIIFERKFRETYDDATDQDNFPRTPGGAYRAYKAFAERYRSSFDFSLVKLNDQPATEIYGTVPISESRVLHFRIDAFGINDSKLYVYMDHKTSSVDSPVYQSQYTHSVQMLAYYHVINCLFPHDDIYGGIVNLTVIRKNDQAFYQLPIRKTIDIMSEWLWNINTWYDLLLRDIDTALKTREDQRVMLAFPKNEHGCIAYNRKCMYQDLCLSWSNPIREVDRCPPDMIVEFWDPSEKEKDAKLFLEVEAKL